MKETVRDAVEQAEVELAPEEVPLTLDYPEAELVFGLVYAVGAEYRPVLDYLEDGIRKARYRPNRIHISGEFPAVASQLGLTLEFPSEPEFSRIWFRMDAGNQIRKKAVRDDFMALVASSKIHSTRKSVGTPEPDAHKRTAHIIDSLKRPEEIETLRKIYGPGFFLIGIFASESARRAYLADQKNMGEDAQRLISRDEKENEPHGQRTRDTFELADVFVSLQGGQYRKGLDRFLSAVFCHPHKTPTRDEQAMFMAYSASLRSGSLARQVGAAIVSKDGDLIGVGCNDVPRPEGGLYWAEEADDHRDYRKGFDSNDRRKNEILDDTVGRLEKCFESVTCKETFRKAVSDALSAARGAKTDNVLSEEVIECLWSRFGVDSSIFKERATAALKGGQVAEITEFGRDVHAEMDAMLSCARVGVSLRGSTLYTTTFPCHNCARHIIAAGITRVVYIEPYPKSRAPELHSDAILVMGDDERKPQDQRIPFDPFVGIGPRRFFDLFSLKLSSGYVIERKQGGRVVPWDPSRDAKPRVPMPPTSYIQREQLVLNKLRAVYKKRKAEEI